MNTAPAPTVTRVIGRYAIFGEIASGGMATVHVGRLLGEAGFTRTVAIKRLHPQFAKEPDFVGMFLDEARLASRIRHPNVVSTLDVVALDGELFLVLDYVQGESLSRLARQVRQQGGRIPPKIALSIMTGVLQGLHAAHEAKSESGVLLGIVHRDVSPQNVLVDGDGVARVIDFGVAKAAGRLQSTRDGVLKGKLQYMSPEQIEGAPLDRRADIYSASVVLWELLAGRRLFQAEDDGALLSQIFNAVVKGKLDPPSKHASSLPKAIDGIVLKGLACKAEDRFGTAKEMAIALEKAAMIATPREVGEWVEKIAGGDLKQKAQRIAEIENIQTVPSFVALAAVPHFTAGVPSGEEPPTVVSSPSVRSASLSSVSSLTAPSAMALSPPAAAGPSTRKTLLLMAMVAAIVMVLGLAAGRYLFGGATPAIVVYSSGPPVTAASVPTAPTSAGTPALAVTDLPLVASTPSAESAPDAAPAVVKGGPGGGGKGVVPGGGAEPGKGKPPPVNCDPPYMIDANGIKRFKPQCLK